jgi:hypothetical protein
MKRLLHLAVALAACGMASQAWAQDAQQDLAAFQRHLKSWPFAHTGRDMPTHFQGYHPDHKEFCVTCYGGGGCGREETCVRCGACNGSKCQRDKIETCRRCGVVGRVFFYECRRLGCGEEGGNGCTKGCPMTVKMCNGKCRTVRPAAFAKWLTGEGESVFWLGGSPDYIPLLSCYGQSKNYEGPRDWYGHCCGCYESYLSTPFDARGPLNFDPALANNCFDEDSIASDFALRRARDSGSTLGLGKGGCARCGRGAPGLDAPHGATPIEKDEAPALVPPTPKGAKKPSLTAPRAALKPDTKPVAKPTGLKR